MSLEADYEALRHGLGAHRVHRDVLAVTGPDAADYLQGQCSQDLGSLAVGEAAEALLLEPDGKLTALLRVLRTAEDAFALDVDGGFGALVAARLGRFKLRSKLAITPLEWACVALRGPGAVPFGGEAGSGTAVVPFRWNGVEGVDLLGPEPDALVPPDARWCGDEAWEALRVEAGIPAMGRELDGHTIAAEVGLLERTVSFTKGCYTGQELVARLDARGNKVARRLCGIVPAGSFGADGEIDVARLIGAPLTVPEREKPVGAVTSAAWCPGLSGPGALAFVHRSVDLPGTVQVEITSAQGEPVAVTATARPLPLA